jgi:hypothetical protein
MRVGASWPAKPELYSVRPPLSHICLCLGKASFKQNIPISAGERLRIMV